VFGSVFHKSAKLAKGDVSPVGATAGIAAIDPLLSGVIWLGTDALLLAAAVCWATSAVVPGLAGPGAAACLEPNSDMIAGIKAILGIPFA
jgi:hypothetical protein